jgi:hypothetical protein
MLKDFYLLCDLIFVHQPTENIQKGRKSFEKLRIRAGEESTANGGRLCRLSNQKEENSVVPRGR